MSDKQFVVVAGANGSGKSEHSEKLLKFPAFDFDLEKINLYRNLVRTYYEMADEIAQRMAGEMFEKEANRCIEEESNFAYETNYAAEEEMVWLDKFDEASYDSTLLYMGLTSVEIAKERVALRRYKGGHNIVHSTIEYKFIHGYENLDIHYDKYNRVVFMNTDIVNGMKPVFELHDNNVHEVDELELEKFKHLIPNLYEHIKSKMRE